MKSLKFNFIIGSIVTAMLMLMVTESMADEVESSIFAGPGSAALLTAIKVGIEAKKPKGVGVVAGNNIYIEGENFSSASRAAVTSREGRTCVRFTEVGIRGPGNIDYLIDVPVTGRYAVEVIYWADGHHNNGMRIHVDGVKRSAPAGHSLAGTGDIWMIKGAWSGHIEWQRHLSHSGPVTVDLTEGMHTFSIYKKAMECPFIDKIILKRI